MKILIKIILCAIFILIAGIIIFGMVYNKPNPKPISILINQSGKNRQNCTVNPVTCDTTQDCVSDCLEASEGLEMICKDITRTTDEQEKIYGKSTKICTDASAKMDCNTDLGGILVYSGSAGDERMEWDCICSYPEYAGSDGCKTINADVCGGPSNKSGFNWTIANGEPSKQLCECPDGKTLIRTDDNKPICIPSSLINWYSDLDIPTQPKEVYFYDFSNENDTRYYFTEDQVDSVAKSVNATVANIDQLVSSLDAGFDVCSIGWFQLDDVKATCTVISTDWTVSGCKKGLTMIFTVTKAGIFLYGIKPPFISLNHYPPYIAPFSKSKWSEYS